MRLLRCSWFLGGWVGLNPKRPPPTLYNDVPLQRLWNILACFIQRNYIWQPPHIQCQIKWIHVLKITTIIINITTVFTEIILVKKQFSIRNCKKNNYKEMASTIELNMKFWSSKTEIVFSCNMYFNNLCFIYKVWTTLTLFIIYSNMNGILLQALNYMVVYL